ncbi:MAG TPA: sigma-70 family RNA polymerase sigma factor [Bryobacteraceae bacterium]|jgi:RNA polymerase sigma-70 factor (ECF subfamily)|nr:sigma-70 family RNA polymerase sigma factor [Bryobacteraceae bacterium]
MELTDVIAVEQAQTGDTDAFRVLVERHSRPVFRLAYRMTGNQQDAEDVVQESFLRAYRQLGRFDNRSSFGTWLYRIAVNCALDLVRARKRRSEQTALGEEQLDPVLNLPATGSTPERMAMSGEISRRVAAAMQTLSENERSAFVMRHFEGMSIEAISGLLGVQPGAAKHSIFRAVQKLRRSLEPLVGTAK